MNRSAALDVGREDLLSWARQEQGADLPPRTADAVLTLLALRGADRRSGLPEPTPPLVAEVLRDDLPAVADLAPAELDAIPAVVGALADRVRAAGRLNGKRRDRLVAAAEDLLPAVREACADPWNLTWHRWYAALLRADGVDTGDPGAVRERLAALDALPHASRPFPPPPLQRTDLARRTFEVRAALTERLLDAFARDVDHPSPPGPLLPAATRDALSSGDPEQALAEELDHVADALLDRWTAEGLSAALDGPYARLAPGPETMPHLALADALLDQHLDYTGDSSVPLPPPPALPEPGELLGLLHAAPLPAALATGAADDDELRPLAERCGFPGHADPVWVSGTPEEVVELAADILALAAEHSASAEGAPAPDEFVDAVHVLYACYDRGCTPDSVARRAADAAGWPMTWELEYSPVPVPPAAPGPYTTPSTGVLAELLRVPAVSERERAELDQHAQALAFTVDRLSRTGCVFRAGDAFGLTPLGAAALRHVLHAGHVAAPDQEEVLAWDAATLVAAAQPWPPAATVPALARWAAARGGDPGWREVLASVPADDDGFLDRLDEAGIPSAVLRAARHEPAAGAPARAILRRRGEDAPDDGAQPHGTD
ncbi:hypothetical protein [Streptomyces sp. CC210A]|uniref:hypothetical protein n=1 Tax=Streptomyces sp. CC210A TaxID=2898184 RepID=UPI001F25EA44|nr:hypothetical protein [Streptomyces sp. CC210A]